MKKLRDCAWSLAALAACGAYLYLHFHRRLDDSHTLVWAVVGGIFALCWFLFSVTSERFHPIVIRLLVGSGGLVATACAVAFVRYTWAERAELQDKQLLPVFILFCLLAAGITAVAWLGLWNSLRGKIRESDDEPDPDEPTVSIL